ncbi:5' nucleotidase, NT5C type [Dyadobacter sediminis]|uniref:5'(3')-deoxyribonucleotidase n=1 Tax=Dyadobacter sediminis TaxID=1493691 RepID=A0A5R9K9F6_9BACT|nr:5'(3')-deoxyribonucleotidase [Dyadobacter sediminis]TLU90681.1 5'(3')-deoxyribonucleotidase [Dyadobacter sediminis]GGC09871.1 5'-3'-deoxyribonucleotidase [Dyadobacter sediminis]
MRKSIAIDMDNVIADIESNWINLYYKEYGVKVTRQDLHGKPEDEAFPDPVAARRLIYQPGFFRYAPIVPGAQEALIKLQEHFDVYIVSAAMEFPNSLPEKYDWLHEHFPSISWKNIVFCGDKRIIDTDYLIDDHLKNLDFCKGTPILFTASHNVNVERHKRVNNWQEALQLLNSELI